MGNFDVTVARPKTAAGGLLAGNLGVKVPTDGKSALEALSYKAMGYIAEDGLSLSEDASDEDVVVWGGFKIRKVRSQFGATIGGVLLSTRDVDTLKRVFGPKNVVSTGNSITVKHGPQLAPRSVFIIETVDEDGFARRYVIPNGQILVSGDRSLTHAGTDGIEFTIEALPDDADYCYYEYTELPPTGV